MRNPRKVMLAVAGLALLSACAEQPAAPVVSTAVPFGSDGQAIVAGAGFTSTNPSVDGIDRCKNGPSGLTTPSVNCNQYTGKQYVWLNGGPNQAGPSALSAGVYFFAILEPSGQAHSPNDGGAHNLSDTDPAGGAATAGCGTGTGCGDLYTNRKFRVANGDIAQNLGTHDESDAFIGTHGKMLRAAYFDDTGNPGGVYIMAICRLGPDEEHITYPVVPSACKYDAFKAQEGDGTTDEFGTISGGKYYDTNTNGQWDVGEPGIPGWLISATDGVSDIITTGAGGLFSQQFIADDYHFAELQPTNTFTLNGFSFPAWIQTGNTVDQTAATPPSTATLANKQYDVHIVDNTTVGGIFFGNVCLGAGGGLTMGFWSNKNGETILKAGSNNFAAALARLVALNLRNANGTNFDPTSYSGNPTATQYRAWLLNATATNMAYMLSAQLSAMSNNVAYNFVSGSALVYAPGANGANGLGFITVSALMSEADTELGLHGLTLAGSPYRAYQEALKNALDRGNNNLNFVQGSPATCPTPTFAAN